MRLSVLKPSIIVAGVICFAQVSLIALEPSTLLPIDRVQIQAKISAFKEYSEVGQKNIPINNKKAIALLNAYKDSYFKAGGQVLEGLTSPVRKMDGDIVSFIIKNGDNPNKYSIIDTQYLYNIVDNIITDFENHRNRNLYTSNYFLTVSKLIDSNFQTGWSVKYYSDLMAIPARDALLRQEEDFRQRGDDAFSKGDWEKAFASYQKSWDIHDAIFDQVKNYCNVEDDSENGQSCLQHQINDLRNGIQKIYQSRMDALRLVVEDTKLYQDLSGNDLPTNVRKMDLYESILSDPIRLSMTRVPAEKNAPILISYLKEQLLLLPELHWIQPDHYSTLDLSPEAQLNTIDDLIKTYSQYKKYVDKFIAAANPYEGLAEKELNMISKNKLLDQDRIDMILLSLKEKSQAEKFSNEIKTSLEELNKLEIQAKIQARERAVIEAERQNELNAERQAKKEQDDRAKLVVSSLQGFQVNYGHINQLVIESVKNHAGNLEFVSPGRYRSVGDFGCLEILSDVLHKIPAKEAHQTELNLNIWVQGFDGSSTRTALVKLRTLIGKYLEIPGDCYKIQADRDYPISGKNEFIMFGGQQVAGPDSVSFINFHCISKIKVPPYQVACVLGKIYDFKLGKNQAGKVIIIPVINVIMVASGNQYFGKNTEIILDPQ